MTAADRRHRLLVLARQEGRLEVSGAAARFRVAPETIRRDLSELERRGLVRRTHGGAFPVENAGFGTGPAGPEAPHVAERRRIAAAAAGLLGEARTVFVDEGRTPHLLSGMLPAGRRLTVVTPSLAAAAAVAGADDITVLLLGGRVRGRTLATVGGWATDMLAGFVVDLAFIGASGISREFGVTTSDPAAAAVKAQAVRSARRRVLVAAHTEFGASGLCRFAEVSDFEAVVTGTGLPAPEAHRYGLLGPRVLRV